MPQAVMTSPARQGVIDLLASRGPMTAAAAARHLDLHVTTVRFHLEQLVGAGLATASFEKQPGVGRPRKVYTVTARAASTSTVRNRAALATLTALLIDACAPAAGTAGAVTPDTLGHRWASEHVTADVAVPADSPGRWMGKIGTVVDVMASWGYAPELRTRSGGRAVELSLRHCPFADLADRSPAVVCGIHRGVLAGTLNALGETDVEVRLDPFVEPDLCRAVITTRSPFTTT